jgi:hypothetical protein
MPGPETIDSTLREAKSDLKDVEREVRDFRNDVARATNDQNQKIHAVEIEVVGASGKLDLIFLAQTDHETRIRSVEKSVIKFAVYAILLGAALSIIATQLFRKFMDTPPPVKLTETYMNTDDGRKRIQELEDSVRAYRDAKAAAK